MRYTIILIITLGFSAPVHAGNLPAEPIVDLLVRGESAPLDVGDDYLFGLTETTLADKAASVGGTVRNEGRGDFSFACVTQGDRTAWFLSDASSNEGEPLLTAAIVSALPLTGTACDAVADIGTVPFDGELPSLGASSAEIEARLGPFELSEAGLVAFRSHDVLGDDGDSLEVVKTVTFHVENDVVDAIAYEQVTIH